MIYWFEEEVRSQKSEVRSQKSEVVETRHVASINKSGVMSKKSELSSWRSVKSSVRVSYFIKIKKKPPLLRLM